MGDLRMVCHRSSEVRSGDSCLAGYWACAASHVIAIGLAVAVWCDCHAVVRFVRPVVAGREATPPVGVAEHAFPTSTAHLCEGVRGH